MRGSSVAVLANTCEAAINTAGLSRGREASTITRVFCSIFSLRMSKGWEHARPRQVLQVWMYISRHRHSPWWREGGVGEDAAP